MKILSALEKSCFGVRSWILIIAMLALYNADTNNSVEFYPEIL